MSECTPADGGVNTDEDPAALTLPAFLYRNGLPTNESVLGRMENFGLEFVEDIKLVSSDQWTSFFSDCSKMVQIKANTARDKFVSTGDHQPSKTTMSFKKRLIGIPTKENEPMPSSYVSGSIAGVASVAASSDIQSTSVAASSDIQSSSAPSLSTQLPPKPSPKDDIELTTSPHLNAEKNDCVTKRMQTDFYRNYVKKAEQHGGNRVNDSLELFAFRNPTEYPDGDVTAHYAKSFKPKFGWATKNRSSGGSKSSRYICLGVYVCPKFDECGHRIRPKVPTSGTIPNLPNENKHCAIHKEPPSYFACKCFWRVIPNEDGTWTVSHSGSHNHPVPPPVTMTRAAEKSMKKSLEVDPTMTPIDLMAGNHVRAGLSTMDVKCMNPNYVKAKKQAYTKALSKEITGSQHVHDSADIFLETRKRFQQAYNGILANSSCGSDNAKWHFTFQTKVMKQRTVEPWNFKQVDTIMSLSNTLFYQGDVWVTMTSYFDIDLMHMAPALVTVHGGMSELDYAQHFDTDNRNFEQFSAEVGSDISKLIERYPGHTMDMSSALYKGWKTSFTKMARHYFDIKEVTDKQLQAILRLCVVHYANNVQKVSNISKLIDPSRAREFRKLARSLAHDNITFDEFESTVLKIQSNFPKVKKWLSWYLHKDRAPHLFHACNRSLDDPDLSARFDSLSNNTNGQEGFGHSLKKYISGDQPTLDQVLEGCVKFCSYYSNAIQLQRAGVDQQYGLATRKQRRKFSTREKKKDYRPPDTCNELERSNKNRSDGIQPQQSCAVSGAGENDASNESRQPDDFSTKDREETFDEEEQDEAKNDETSKSSDGSLHAQTTRYGRTIQRPQRAEFVRWSLVYRKRKRATQNNKSKQSEETPTVVDFSGDRSDESSTSDNSSSSGILREQIEPIVKDLISPEKDDKNDNEVLDVPDISVNKCGTDGDDMSAISDASDDDSATDRGYILRVGDVISYTGYFNDEVVAPIKRIGPSDFKTDGDELHVYTTHLRAGWATYSSGNCFKLVSSSHPDAPPVNKYKLFERVTLEEGQLETNASESHVRAQETIEKTPQGDAIAALVHTATEIKKKWPKMHWPAGSGATSSHSPNGESSGDHSELKDERVVLLDDLSQKTVIGDVGYKAKRYFHKGWYSGVVTSIRFDEKGNKICMVVYEDSDREELTIDQLEVHSSRAISEEAKVLLEVNKIVAKIDDNQARRHTMKPTGKSAKPSGVLPFLPVLTPLHVQLADLLRSRHRILPTELLNRIKSNAVKRLPGDIFALDGELLNFDQKYEPSVQSTNPKSYHVMDKCIKSLDDNEKIFEAIIGHAALLFNIREYEKFVEKPDYRGTIMLNGYQTFNMCFKKNAPLNKKGSEDLEFTEQYDPLEVNKALKFKVRNKEGVMVTVSVDIFAHVQWIVFPFNVTNWHWVFFSINPNTLEQRFYDSLHGNLENYSSCMHVSKMIHKWVLDHHMMRHGKQHNLHDTIWSRSLVCDNHDNLGTNLQTGVDCGLYTIAQPFLMQPGLYMRVFGDTDAAKAQAGRELRQRVLLWMFLGECFLEPDTEKILKLKNDKIEKGLEKLKTAGKDGHVTKKKRKRRTAD